MKTIAIIGAGNLGLSIAEGLYQNGYQLHPSRRKRTAVSANVLAQFSSKRGTNYKAVAR